jgi:hypothetical protein
MTEVAWHDNPSGLRAMLERSKSRRLANTCRALQIARGGTDTCSPAKGAGDKPTWAHGTQGLQSRTIAIIAIFCLLGVGTR